ncbi:helix-turn-helix domain-containing protein [Kingella kingae]|uniref:helix-turn-helix domain-containing protein n=2 Tax=Kingella kingae TaxID=504 RepID=UPI002549FC90|nr:helix-turn-helix domain-containing protein [Kingella kingae]MDK4576775.1 helix-turn-helix domain-containing protein [Kingella kingae]MDK4582819.1 helix-turn-helix domain-containing protein [Kingella kingae]MDK4592911.1 helix-turn-helix domain-containing protein [Kingella kingae]MDK4595014.1 helix-turn-helix domain-containing protein [Kingella kingae]MDK4644680.1 helix-turn-helix domain-containing protein [Kingella kingae]
MTKKSAETPKEDWHRADIVAALKKQGWSVAALAREAGLAQSTLYTALTRPYPNGEKIIAQALGKKPEDIWAKRYEERNFKPVLHNI